jgi:hypothetical protein
MTKHPSLRSAIQLFLSLTAVALSVAPPAVASQGAPVNVELPVVTGSSYIGGHLAVSAGKWEGEPTAFTYQWLHCANAVRGGALYCDPIRGANTAQYVPEHSDLFSHFAVDVKASNGVGVTTARSAYYGYVVYPPTTILEKHPPKRTSRTHARFTFSVIAAHFRFECKIDEERFSSCDSPLQVNLGPGHHLFEVKAITGGGPDRTPAQFRWWVSPGRSSARKS